MAQRIQKISIHAGFTCPNRDGQVGWGGCTYCNNKAFVPDYCRPEKSITEQLEEGIAFFSAKYPTQQYIAYFQSYTNTYASFERLQELYEEALAYPGVVGLIIGTRPDCTDNRLLGYLASLLPRAQITVEYGIESTDDDTLRFINRGHDYACAVDAVRRAAAFGLSVTGHLILGLPGEDRDTLLLHADRLSQLPLDALKLHQLQLVRNTLMARQYTENPELFRFFTPDGYIDMVIDFLERLRPDIHLERFVSQSPKELLIAPDWGLKNYEFIDRLHKRMAERQTWQGRLYMINSEGNCGCAVK